MHLGLLSQERLSFDPIEPLILRGPPTDVSTSVFSGNVVLSLARSTKIASIIVTFKSTATTYWPEGIGARGTRLTYEKVLSEESVHLREIKKNGYIKLPAGIHRFPFAFIVPNNIVETIEDVYGRVRHTVDAKVNGYGIQILNNWHISKPVLVLRAYMSDSLLTNNSLQDLSRTYEKHLPAGDIQMVVERAAYSSGDLFFVKLIIEPQMKHVRLEHMEITITETRRFHVSEVHANRKDAEQFTFPYLAASKLEEGGESTPRDLSSVFTKNARGIDLTDTIAYRITFATPSCMRNIHHTTYYKDILFKHHLNINIILSFPDDTQSNNSTTSNQDVSKPSGIRPNLTTHSSTSSYGEESSTMASQRPTTTYSESGASIEQQAADAALALLPPPATFKYMSTNTNTHIRSPINTLFPIINTSTVGITISTPSPCSTPPPNTATTNYFNAGHANGNNQNSAWLSKLRKHQGHHGHKGDDQSRKRETIRLETPITVFDCRLKEDYGRLPSYSELNVTAHPTHGDDKSKMLPDMLMEQDLMLQCMPDSDIQIPSSEPQPQLCPCYFKFRRQMEMASQAQLLANASSNTTMLERVPSLPPPDYVE
ncbi:hypothetical protein K501DRAFT_229415, partial [Backusella circina FSU 941]